MEVCMSTYGILTVQLEQHHVSIKGDGSKLVRKSVTFDGKLEKVRIPEERVYSSEYRSRVRVTRLTKDQIDYFKSVESAPNHRKTKEKWKFMKPNERLHYHLSQIAEGNPFKFELLG